MNAIKEILIVGHERQMLQQFYFKLIKTKAYSVRSMLSNVRIDIEFVRKNLMSLINNEGFEPDLIIMIGLGLKPNESEAQIADMISYELEESQTNILFIQDGKRKGGKMNIKKQVCIIDFIEFSDDVLLQKLINSLLGLSSNDQRKRVSINNKVKSHYIDQDPAITPRKSALISKLRSKHYFEDRALDKMHVPIGPDEIFNHEEEVDIELGKKLKNEYRFYESAEHFHLRFIEDTRRMTYLLLGHRGSGKSSFIHHYFKTYILEKGQSVPYVIIDFFNYGFLVDERHTQYKVSRALYDYVLENQIYSILSKHSTFITFKNTIVLKEVIHDLKALSTEFSSVIDSELQFDILQSIGDIGEVHVGERLIRRGIIFSKEYDENFQLCFEKDPWRCLDIIIEYISEGQKKSVSRFFIEWILYKAFYHDKKMNYGNAALFTSKLDDFYRENILDKRIEELPHNELRALFNEFIRKSLQCFGTIYIILDNVDRLSASISESYVLSEIKPNLALDYPNVKILMAARPVTYARNTDTINEVIAKENAIYDCYWLNPVKLKSVIKKSLHTLKEDTDSEEEGEFIELLLEIIELPVYNRMRAKGRDSSVFDIITGLTGNNIRLGKECFSNLLASNYKRLNETKGSGLLRIAPDNSKYIAEHIAIRSIFLGNKNMFAFEDNLINLFNTPGISGYASTLIQIRILEVLKKQRICSLAYLYEHIKPIGYSELQIQAGLRNLNLGRLILTIPFNFLDTEPSQTEVLLRHRGSFYFDHLLNNLSYIQMVYFLTELHEEIAEPLSFPSQVKATNSELHRLIDNFLQNMWIELNIELNNAKIDGIRNYEAKITPLVELHNKLTNIYYDLQRMTSHHAN